ncbi:hypothetical protein OG883_08230 [Streptomyces sp. NBC_01142]|nr:hypothetical protein [Streptomyces sp. NBC_01142]MCX4819891.1 hypothetical protein [Streptomyces sp. NBC_01142]
MQNKGWMDPDAGWEILLGTTGQALNLEAVEMWIE